MRHVLVGLAALGLVGGAGCSSILGIDDLGAAGGPNDGGPRDGGSSDGPPPGSITIAGQIELLDQASMPAANARVDVVIRGQGQVLGSATTDPGGVYRVTYMPPPGAVDVNLVVAMTPAQPNALATFVYFAEPVTNDTTTSFTIFTDVGLRQVTQLVGIDPSPNQGSAVVLAQDANGQPLGGAMIFADTAGTMTQLFYSGPDGLPRPGLNATDPQSGTAWLINGPPSVQFVLQGVNGSTSQSFIEMPPHSFSYVPMRGP